MKTSFYVSLAVLIAAFVAIISCSHSTPAPQPQPPVVVTPPVPTPTPVPPVLVQGVWCKSTEGDFSPCAPTDPSGSCNVGARASGAACSVWYCKASCN